MVSAYSSAWRAVQWCGLTWLGALQLLSARALVRHIVPEVGSVTIVTSFSQYLEKAPNNFFLLKSANQRFR